MGKIFIVIKKEGILRDTISHKMELYDWESVININLNGVFTLDKQLGLPSKPLAGSNAVSKPAQYKTLQPISNPEA